VADYSRTHARTPHANRLVSVERREQAERGALRRQRRGWTAGMKRWRKAIHRIGLTHLVAVPGGAIDQPVASVHRSLDGCQHFARLRGLQQSATRRASSSTSTSRRGRGVSYHHETQSRMIDGRAARRRRQTAARGAWQEGSSSCLPGMCPVRAPAWRRQCSDTWSVPRRPPRRRSARRDGPRDC
jgi:hypothetical protein